MLAQLVNLLAQAQGQDPGNRGNWQDLIFPLVLVAFYVLSNLLSKIKKKPKPDDSPQPVPDRPPARRTRMQPKPQPEYQSQRIPDYSPAPVSRRGQAGPTSADSASRTRVPGQARPPVTARPTPPVVPPKEHPPAVTGIPPKRPVRPARQPGGLQSVRMPDGTVRNAGHVSQMKVQSESRKRQRQFRSGIAHKNLPTGKKNAVLTTAIALPETTPSPLERLLASRADVIRGVVLAEILGPPIALRSNSGYKMGII